MVGRDSVEPNFPARNVRAGCTVIRSSPWLRTAAPAIASAPAFRARRSLSPPILRPLSLGTRPFAALHGDERERDHFRARGDRSAGADAHPQSGTACAHGGGRV